MLFVVKIIISKLRKRRDRVVKNRDTSDTNSDNIYEKMEENQDIFTIPNENKVVINNFNVIINTCECSKCKSCPERYKTSKNYQVIDQELLLSVVKSKFPSL